MTLRVELIRTYRELMQLEPQWSSLESRATFGEWLSGPDWILPFLGAYADTHQPRCAFVYEGSRLSGVVPFVHSRMSFERGVRLGTPRHPHVRRTGWLADSSPDLILAAALRAALPSLRGACVAQVPSDGLEDGYLESARQQLGLSGFRREESSSAVADTGNGWPSYCATRESKLLRALRRHLRRLDAADGWKTSVTTSIAELDPAWAALIEVERRSWKQQTQTSIDSEKGTECLYREVSRRFAAKGALRLFLLEKDELPVAHALIVLRNRRAYLLKNSFDEAFRSYSVGISLVWRAMESVANEGVVQFDFLGDTSDWKRSLASSEPSYFSAFLYPGWRVDARMRGFLEAKLKPWLREHRLTRIGSDT